MNLNARMAGDKMLNMLRATAENTPGEWFFVSARPLPALHMRDTRFYIQFRCDGQDYDCDSLPVHVMADDPEAFTKDLIDKVFITTSGRLCLAGGRCPRIAECKERGCVIERNTRANLYGHDERAN